MLNLIKPCGQLLRFFFPNYCRECGSLLDSDIKTSLCLRCFAKLPWNKNACLTCALPLAHGQNCGACINEPLCTHRCLSPFIYKPPISNFIMQLKFQQQLWCGRLLGQLLTIAIQEHYKNLALPECIIPIPLHNQRLRQRGFNQAIEIAKPIAKQFQIPLLYNYYYRRLNTQPQSQLSAAQRRQNLNSAFSWRKRPQVKYVAVLDDVITTGQTIREFNKILGQQGIEKIDVWSCARAI